MQSRRCAHFEHRRDRARAHLIALPDRDDPEFLVGRVSAEQVGDQSAVAGLEDVQGQHEVRYEDRPEGE